MCGLCPGANISAPLSNPGGGVGRDLTKGVRCQPRVYPGFRVVGWRSRSSSWRFELQALSLERTGSPPGRGRRRPSTALQVCWPWFYDSFSLFPRLHHLLDLLTESRGLLPEALMIPEHLSFGSRCGRFQSAQGYLLCGSIRLGIVCPKQKSVVG